MLLTRFHDQVREWRTHWRLRRLLWPLRFRAAGLLLRDLLDRFDGDVEKAVGAYNGGCGIQILVMPPASRP